MKKNNLIKITCAAFAIFLMTMLAELTNEKEIIFPEIAALTIGLLIIPKQPWKVGKLSMFILMTLSAVMGLVFNLYLPLPIYLKITLSFIFIASSLTISGTTLIPMVSACILPILLNTRSWIYPVSVSSLSVLVIMLQLILEKLGIKSVYIKNKDKMDMHSSIKIWLKRLAVFMIAAIIPCYTKNFYFIAPPLLVAFIEMTNSENKARKSPGKVVFLITICAILGTFFSLIMNNHLGMPLTLCTVLSYLCSVLAMKNLKLYMPPAGAIAALPMILPYNNMIFYPLEVLIGATFLTFCSILFFKKQLKSAHATIAA